MVADKRNIEDQKISIRDRRDDTARHLNFSAFTSSGGKRRRKGDFATAGSYPYPYRRKRRQRSNHREDVFRRDVVQVKLANSSAIGRSSPVQ